jgi:hypothetical protein
MALAFPFIIASRSDFGHRTPIHLISEASFYRLKDDEHNNELRRVEFQLLTEMSTSQLSARKADNLTSICEPIV